MKQKLHLVVLAALVLGVGAVMWSPRGGGEESKSSLAADSGSSHGSKSERPADRRNARGVVAPHSAIERDLIRERSDRLAQGDVQVFGRTFTLPLPGNADLATRPPEADRVLNAVSLSGQPKAENSGSASSSSLSAQVIAHKRGRNEFMRQRYEELASHTPGCRCAHHLGRN